MSRDRYAQAPTRHNVYAPMRSSHNTVLDAPSDLVPLAITLIVTLAVVATAFSIIARELPVVNAIFATMDGLVTGLVAALLPGLKTLTWRTKYWNMVRALAYAIAVVLLLPFSTAIIIHPLVPAAVVTLLLSMYLMERSYQQRRLVAASKQ